MKFDDQDKSGSETPPEWSAASGNPGSGSDSGFAAGDRPGESDPTTASDAPAPVSPPAWDAPTPSAPSPWQQPAPTGWNAAPPVQPQWGTQPAPQPTWPPAPAWQPQSGWGAPAPARTSSGSGRLPVIISVIAACLIAFSGGLVTDRLGFPTPSTGAPAGTLAPGATKGAVSPAQAAALYNEAEQVIKQNWVGRSSITDQQLVDGSIAGMVNSLGDTGHSEYLSAQEYAGFQSSLGGSLAGIGVVLADDNGAFVVTRALKGAPAAKAGVQSGDVITAVNGTSTANMTFSEFTSKVRGAAGTKVTITVIHPGSSQPVDIAIVRAVFSVPLADWGMIPGTHIADISLAEFSTGAADQVQIDIDAAKAAGATSIILDLRGNPGGYASEALDVASEFLASGTVYIEQDSSGKKTPEIVSTKRQHTKLPLVVLVDHDSASSSEITAGALQDAGRAKIVGVNTFGTGTVLQPFTLSDGSVIILGTAWWLTPNGHRIFGVGITPDQKVLMPGIAQPTDPTTLAALTAAQFSASTDAQLLAAVADLSH